MTLSVYDPIKNCFVLKQPKPTINAFHPDYMKTYHPTFFNDMRVAQRDKNSGDRMAKHVEKVRKTNPSHGTLFGITDKAISVAPKEMMLKVKEFHIYNKAGMPKGVKK